VQLLAWEVAETEYDDPDNPGIPVDSPERRRLNDLGSRLPHDQRPWGVAGYCHPSAQAVLDDYRRGHADLAARLAFGGPGEYREAARALRATIDRLTSTGYRSIAVVLLGLLGRLHLCFGELDQAAAVQTEGEQFLDRVEPGSNAAGQFEGIAIWRSQLVDLDLNDALQRLERYNAAARSDAHWVSGALRLWCAYLRAAMGHHQQGLDGLAANLAVIERGFLGAPNYPVIVHLASCIAWEAGSAAHTEVLERNLTAKVLEPDFCYLETDARWTAALLCALTGRPDEARRWFQDAHDRITQQEAILLLPHVCCDEARMEIRLGTAGDRRNGLRRLDEARRWTDTIGLPAFAPRIDDLAEQLKG
jgi:ATP/maltotriose-dependent transcriptional regulator MalT